MHPFTYPNCIGCIVSFVESLANQKALKQKERVEVNYPFGFAECLLYFLDLSSVFFSWHSKLNIKN